MKLITIGIGVYLRQKSYFKNTLNSILNNILKNNYRDKIKILIINDYDTQVQDFIIAKQYANVYSDLFQLKTNDKNRGIAYTYNRMVKQCNTKYFMAFDSDDVITPFNIIDQVNFLQSNPQYGGSYGKRWLYDFIRNIGYKCIMGSKYNLNDFINFTCPVTHNAIILRVSDALATNNYIPNYLSYIANSYVTVACDFSMFVAMLLYKDLYFDDQVRCLYNEHDKCFHKQKSNLFISQFENIAKCIIRYSKQQNFKYVNMKPLTQSAMKFLNNQNYYIQNSWLRNFVK